MAKDPNKLKAFVEQDNPSPGTGGDEGGGGDDLEFSPEDDSSEEAQNERKMNPVVGYMELSEEAGAFSCGTCTFGVPSAESGKGTCINELVRAEVSASNGCCNLFHPAEAEIVFPPQGGESEEEEPEEKPDDDDDESDDEDGGEGGGDEEDEEGGGE